jgi:hypothetical protein
MKLLILLLIPAITFSQKKEKEAKFDFSHSPYSIDSPRGFQCLCYSCAPPDSIPKKLRPFSKYSTRASVESRYTWDTTRPHYREYRSEYINESGEYSILFQAITIKDTLLITHSILDSVAVQSRWIRVGGKLFERKN